LVNLPRALFDAEQHTLKFQPARSFFILQVNAINSGFMKKYSFILLFLFAWQWQVSAQTAEEILFEKAIPFDNRYDLTAIADWITDERLVLMGEASHGTSEFYTKRAILSKHLVANKGFNFVAVEGDWSSFSRINEYVKHKEGGPQTIEEAMDALDRWPLWMWRNQEFKALVQWLHDFNADREPSQRAGLYGIDVYNNFSAMEDVEEWVRSIDSTLGRRTARLNSCISRHPDPGAYVRMVAQTGQDCSEDLLNVLEIVQSLEDHPDATEWRYFRAVHGAKVAINAERHFRGNLEPQPASWNYRASHFYLTAERLMEYYGEGSRGIVWAHNTHIGDARATDMANFNMHNIGQLSREALGRENVFAIGFGTYAGEVLAAREWEGEMRTMNTPEARSGTWENILGQSAYPKLYFNLRDNELASILQQRIPHRAIGVTYNPANEDGNYVPTVIPDRYDAFIFIRETRILDALDQ